MLVTPSQVTAVSPSAITQSAVPGASVTRRSLVRSHWEDGTSVYSPMGKRSRRPTAAAPRSRQFSPLRGPAGAAARRVSLHLRGAPRL